MFTTEMKRGLGVDEIYRGLTLDSPDCKAESCHCLDAVLGVQTVLLAGPQALA
jgi:hypothetical protein